MSEVDSFENFRKQLELLEWPNVYLFKFITPGDSELIAKVSALFDDSAELKFQESKNGKYVSVSAKELMMDVESIIEKYKKAALIEGVIAL